MKITFNSDKLPLNKILKLHNMTIVLRSVVIHNFFLDECLYEYNC